MIQFTEVNSKTTKDRDSGSWSTEKPEFMKGNGKMILEMAKVWKGTQMVTDMKAILKMGNLTEKVFTLGQMEKSMKVNGLMA